MASIKKINSRKYKITVSNGYRLDGRKISRAKTICVPATVHPRSIQQYVAHEAEEFERQVKNGFGEDAETPFEEYAESWLKRQTKLAPGTLAMYTRMLKVAYQYIGQIPLSKLRPIALEKMLIELRKKKCRGKTIQEATVQKYLTAVSAVLTDAKKNEIIQKNPARMIDLPDTESREQHIPNADEVDRFFRALADEPLHFRYFYLFAIYTGCRRGELCALKWTDFSIQNDTTVLTVSRSRSSVAGVGVVEGPTKNGRSRTIVFDDMMSWSAVCYLFNKDEEAQRGGFTRSEYLFADEHGKLIHPDTFTKRLRKIYDRIGLSKDYHLHTWRHFFITSLLHSGVDKQTVADLAGHGDTSFLERTYCHPQLERKREASSCLFTQVFGPVTYSGDPADEAGEESNNPLTA